MIYNYSPILCIFKILKIHSLEILSSIIISCLVLFSTRFSVQFFRGTIERGTIEELYWISNSSRLFDTYPSSQKWYTVRILDTYLWNKNLQKINHIEDANNIDFA